MTQLEEPQCPVLAPDVAGAEMTVLGWAAKNSQTSGARLLYIPCPPFHAQRTTSAPFSHPAPRTFHVSIPEMLTGNADPRSISEMVVWSLRPCCTQ